MATSYKARARRHVLQAEKVNLQEALDKAKMDLETAKSPAAFHSASARYEELSGRMAQVKKKLKRRKKATGLFGMW